MRKLYLVLVLVLLRPGLRAQLPVSREPHHKVVLENAYVRVLEGRIKTNDSTPAHLHAANSVVVFLSSSTFGIGTAGDKAVITTVRPGDLKYAPYGDKPVNHIVWNQTPVDFQFLVVELAPHRQADSSRLVVGAGVSRLGRIAGARLLIVISGRAFVGEQSFGPGEVKFLFPNTLAEVKGSARCVILTVT
jgi:hypothetical protein